MPQIQDIIAKFNCYLLLDLETLLSRHRFLLEADFGALGDGPTSNRLLWLTNMDSAISAATLAESGTLTGQAGFFCWWFRSLFLLLENNGPLNLAGICSRRTWRSVQDSVLLEQCQPQWKDASELYATPQGSSSTSLHLPVRHWSTQYHPGPSGPAAVLLRGAYISVTLQIYHYVRLLLLYAGKERQKECLPHYSSLMHLLCWSLC